MVRAVLGGCDRELAKTKFEYLVAADQEEFLNEIISRAPTEQHKFARRSRVYHRVLLEHMAKLPACAWATRCPFSLSSSAYRPKKKPEMGRSMTGRPQRPSCTQKPVIASMARRPL